MLEGKQANVNFLTIKLNFSMGSVNNILNDIMHMSRELQGVFLDLLHFYKTYRNCNKGMSKGIHGDDSMVIIKVESRFFTSM